jgi:hypothetical protein
VVTVGNHRTVVERSVSRRDGFLPARSETAWKWRRKGEVRALWETAKAETTLRNARHAAEKPSASRSQRESKSQRNNANLSNPDIIAQEIVEDLEAALSQFAAIASDLHRN